jgi:membrane associated rhomboid family serine protease
MGESDRYHRDDRKHFRKNRITLGASGNSIVTLFALNIIFFLILLTIQVGMFVGEKTPEFFYTHVVQWFELPSGLTKFSERPWTFLVYMFTEVGVMRLISNMIWLWAFGYILQDLAGNDKMIPIYIYGGLLGAVFFITAHYVLPPLATVRGSAGLLGANAGVLAVAMATTALEPGYRFFRQIRGGIPIWVLMGLYVLIDFAGVAKFSAAYSLSHLGGALAGFLFVVFLRKGKDGSVWMNKSWNWFINLFTPPPSKQDAVKDKIFYNTGNTKPYVKTPNLTQKRVDEILDKINNKGYHFLTDEEKDFLKKAAEDENL